MIKRRMKISAAIAGAVLLGSAVAGCGGSSEASAYCDDMKSANKDFGAINAGDFTKLDAAFATFHKLAAESPSKIEADWTVLESAITAIEKGFKDAGIKFSDLAGLQNGKVPEGVDAAKLTQLSATMGKFGDAKFNTASDNIAKHAKDECKVDIAN
ncbi:MAG: hypothetical protein H7288_14375 [Kineosporiaceae bacterium]|nr:hypothetical protein [Aeromicrobium sp.]